MQKHSSSQKSHGLVCVVCVCIAGTKETRFTYIYYQWESSRSFQLMFPDTFTAAAQKHQHTVTYSVGLSLLATSWTLKPWSSLWTVPGVPSFAHCHAKSPEKRFVHVQSARRGQKSPQCSSCIKLYHLCSAGLCAWGAWSHDTWRESTPSSSLVIRIYKESHCSWEHRQGSRFLDRAVTAVSTETRSQTSITSSSGPWRVSQ